MVKEGELIFFGAKEKAGKSYFLEYKKELERLEQQGLQPIGINEHLESLTKYIEWKKRTKDLFDGTDNAKDLI